MVLRMGPDGYTSAISIWHSGPWHPTWQGHGRTHQIHDRIAFRPARIYRHTRALSPQAGKARGTYHSARAMPPACCSPSNAQGSWDGPSAWCRYTGTANTCASGSKLAITCAARQRRLCPVTKLSRVACPTEPIPVSPGSAQTPRRRAREVQRNVRAHICSGVSS